MIINDYYGLSPYFFINKPKYKQVFDAYVQNNLDMIVTFEQLRESIQFDTAVGVQLDLIGEILDMPRTISPPIYENYFSWNISELGWNLAKWVSKDVFTTTSQMDDDLYRMFLKYKASIITWDGTVPSLYEALNFAFGDKMSVSIIDLQDMHVQIKCKFFADTKLSLKQAILQGSLPMSCLGVSVVFMEDLNG